jgi:prophage DNA circulation protein
MTSWRDQLRPASFRGEPFGVEGHDSTHGRRVVMHEYPMRDLPSTEDMGRNARSFSIEGFVVGDDYMQRRDRIISACEDSDEPGQLVHPYLGTMLVRCEALRVSEHMRGGRMVRLQFQFVEAGESEYPSEQRDLVVDVDSVAGDLVDAAGEDFAARYSIDELPDYTVVSTRGILDDAVDALRDLRDLVDDATNFEALLGEWPSQLTEIEQITRGTFAMVSVRGERLIRAIEQSAIMGVIRALNNRPDVPLVAGLTPDREQERQNNAAVVDLVTAHMIAEASTHAARGEWQAYPDAVEAREAIVAAIDEQLEADTVSDAVYDALLRLRSEVARAVPRDEQLPRLTTIHEPESVPSIVLSYRLYGTPDRGDELAARNRAPHPGFLPPGDLEVLADV